MMKSSRPLLFGGAAGLALRLTTAVGTLGAVAGAGLLTLPGCSSSPSAGAESGDAGQETDDGSLGSSGRKDAGASAADDGGSGDDATTGRTPMFTMEVDVPAGAEIFKCQLVPFPTSGYVTEAAHDLTNGSHHFLLYTTDYTAMPAGADADQIKDCSDGSNFDMNHVRGLLYAAQTPKADYTYPTGVGMPVTANQVLLFQVHYLNPSTAPMHVKVNAYFTVDTVGTTITQKASTIFWYDPFIHVPAGKKAKAQMRCLLPKDITIMGASSHYHARGVNYGAYVDEAADQPSTTPFYTTTNWEDPEAYTKELPLKAGTRIRYECDYDNSAGTADYFQGQSAKVNEMCMFIASYYPAMDTDTDFCLKGGDMYGTGTVSCVDSLSCLGKCLSAPAGGDAGTPVVDAGGAAVASDASASSEGGVPSGTADLTPCIQQCFTDSCPRATTTLVPVVNCLETSCAAECGGAAAGAGAADAGPVDPVTAVATGLGNLVGGVGNLLLAPIDLLLGKPIGGAADTCTPCIQQKCTDVLNACVNDKTCGY